MSEPPTFAHQPALPRHKLTALGVVGALIVALPLVQVLRYQNDELLAVLNERAAIDPVGRAVAVQRGLMAHRDVAARVLHGQQALEPERRLRQGEVDDRLASLSLALASGYWERAIQEARALVEDWSRLSRQVLARGLSAAESDQAHRLLVEQTLQVIDLVALALAPGGPGAGEVPATALAQALPRLAWGVASLGEGGPDAGQRAKERAALQGQLMLFEEALQARAVTLAQRTHTVQTQRATLLGALAALFTVGALLAWRVARGLRLRPAAPAAPAAPDPAPLGQRRRHDEAADLLRRLREGQANTPASSPGQTLTTRASEE